MGPVWLRRASAFTFCLLLCLSLSRCASVPPRPEKLPPFNGFGTIPWGTSLEEAKKRVKAEGKEVYEERIHRPPFAFYASGTYLRSPARFTYFFTPHSKKLYRVDVTLDDPTTHKTAFEDLTAKFGPPSHSQGNVDQWFWTDHSLVILQFDAPSVEIAYCDGKHALVNHRERSGSLAR